MSRAARAWLLALARKEPNPYFQAEIFYQVWGWNHV
jgi:hypothetical protein